MIATSGLHDSFSRIKKLAFAIRHARWNVGNFKRCIEYESIANLRDIVDVTCRILTAFPTAATRTGFVHVLYP